MRSQRQWGHSAGLVYSQVAKWVGTTVEGKVTNVSQDRVFVDVGAVRDGIFHAPDAARKFKKGDTLFCEVLAVQEQLGKLKIQLKPPTREHEEPVSSKLRRHGTPKEATADPLSHPNCKPFVQMARPEQESAWGSDLKKPPLHRAPPTAHGRAPPPLRVKVGDYVKGRITNVANGRVFVDFGGVRDGLIVQSELEKEWDLRAGDSVPRLKVVMVDESKDRFRLKLVDPVDEDAVVARLERDWGRCLALYVHGSTIFSNKEPLDIDLLAVVDEPTLRKIGVDSVDAQFKLGRYEVSVYPRSYWLRKLAEMDLTMLTCASLPAKFVLRELDPKLRLAEIDPVKLHESVVGLAEFTWVKSHFMLDHNKDTYKSSKNVYFVLRVLELGRQLLQHGRITAFTAANHWWDKVQSLYTRLSIQTGDWDLVEATLARTVQLQFVEFEQAWRRCMQDCWPRRLPQSVFPLVCEFLIASPPLCRPLASSSCPGRDTVKDQQELCALCSQPLLAQDETVVTLVQCLHRFHSDCIVANIRSQLKEKKTPKCHECQKPFHLSLDRNTFKDREESLLVNGRRRFGGYPATTLLPEERADDDSARALLIAMTTR